MSQIRRKPRVKQRTKDAMSRGCTYSSVCHWGIILHCEIHLNHPARDGFNFCYLDLFNKLCTESSTGQYWAEQVRVFKILNRSLIKTNETFHSGPYFSGSSLSPGYSIYSLGNAGLCFIVSNNNSHVLSSLFIYIFKETIW